MKTSEIMDFINVLEERFPVERWTIDRIHIWPLIRRKIYFWALPLAMSDKAQAGSSWTRVFGENAVSRLLWKAVRLEGARIAKRSRFIFRERPYDALFFNSRTHYDFVNGQWYSRICDPLRSCFQRENLSSLTLISGWDYIEPLHSDSIFAQHDIMLARIKGLIRSRRTVIDKKDFSQYAEFEAFLETQAPFPTSVKVDEIKDYAYQIRSVCEFLKIILRKAKPKMGFVGCYYDTDKMAFNLACLDLGIPSVDIQHGLQGENHLAYGKWNRVPETGYELLPSLFWCWDETDSAAIESWCRKTGGRHRTITGGNLYLRKWASGDASFTRSSDRQISSMKAATRASVHVLFALNGVSPGEKTKLLAIVNKSASLGLPYFFWIRLHPLDFDRHASFSRFMAASAVQENWNVQAASRLPLPALLRHMDVHVTEFSSVVIEARYFGVPSVITDKGGADTFPEYVSSGWARPAYGTEEVLAAIKTLSQKKADLAARKHEKRDEAAIRDLIHRMTAHCGFADKNGK